MKLTRLALAISCALASGTLFAASLPDIGNALRQAQPAPPPAAPQPALPAIQGAPTLQSTPPGAPQGPQVEVDSFAIEGNHVIDKATLLALVANAAHQSYTVAQLDGVAERITRYYRAHGYFVARAYIPPQEIEHGAVTIRIIEGNYDQFHLTNRSLVRDSVVQRVLDHVKGYDVVSTDSLERAMLILNDTPGVRVTRADVMPGSQVGTSDFAVETVATPRVDGYVSLDNYGSSYTGLNRLSVNLNVNSPLGLGDQLSLTGLTTDRADLLNGRIDYSVLLAPNGLRGDIAGFDTKYDLGGKFAPLGATGTAKGINLGLSYPLLRTQMQTLTASVTGTYESLRDDIEQVGTTTPRDLASMAAGLSLRDERPLFGLAGVTQASLSVEFGDVDITNASALSIDQAPGGAHTDGGFSKLVAQLSRATQLPAQFTLTTSLQLQHVLNNKNLDSSEQMAVSGWTGVMAYPSGELLGDNALLLRGELSHPLPTLASLQSAASFFVDYGQADDVHPVNGTPMRHLSDLGASVNAHYRNATLIATLAHRLGGGMPESEPYPRNKFLVQGIWAF